MLEQMLVHEAVIAFRVVFGKIDVLIHVESDDIFERDTSGLVGIDELLIHTNGRRSSRKSYSLKELAKKTYPGQKASREWD